MDRDTLLALNALNRAFYSSTAAGFSATRRRAWRGFERAAGRIAAALPSDALPQLLDVGCGNGRFAEALLDRLERPFAYLGIDASEALLAEARARHVGRSGFRFGVHDFVVDPLAQVIGSQRFHTILLLGVLHHVPGSATRERLLAECAQHLAPGGVMVLTLWRFERLERLRRRSVPWAEAHLPQPLELEPGDHLLAFGPGAEALRYCHAFGDDESAALLEPLRLEGLERIDTWLADGETDDLNRWLVLRAIPRADEGG